MRLFRASDAHRSTSLLQHADSHTLLLRYPAHDF
ncbi:MAG: hypothetical protein FD157_4008 [Rhodocyclaceae bacterium]|nr:MAG: hypothetical protein FD157_4008 [Rhodocyclaceae bacterium]TNC98492.1 MAG: hypothetical protein FD118_3996 [Rhodocyclaceae bacterium]